MDINSRINQIIEKEKLTPNSFANKLGIKATVIYNILKGRNKPSFDIISKILTTFKVDANWLLATTTTTGKYIISNDVCSEDDALDNLEADIDLNHSLIKLAQSSLLYIEFHLLDIELNLKLAEEKVYNKSFDRNKHEEALKKVDTACKVMNAVLRNGQVSNKTLIDFLLKNDELIREMLDYIRKISKDLYLNN
jgi:transcriptional regulator with XRE-family HTH domain